MSIFCAFCFHKSKYPDCTFLACMGISRKFININVLVIQYISRPTCVKEGKPYGCGYINWYKLTRSLTDCISTALCKLNCSGGKSVLVCDFIPCAHGRKLQSHRPAHKSCPNSVLASFSFFLWPHSAVYNWFTSRQTKHRKPYQTKHRKLNQTNSSSARL